MKRLFVGLLVFGAVMVGCLTARDWYISEFSGMSVTANIGLTTDSAPVLLIESVDCPFCKRPVYEISQEGKGVGSACFATNCPHFSGIESKKHIYFQEIWSYRESHDVPCPYLKAFFRRSE